MSFNKLAIANTDSTKVVADKFSVRFERITPTRAAELLGTLRPVGERDTQGRTHNPRNSTERRIERYSKDMAEGHWVTTHQGVAIDDEGHLFDGIHRLKSILRSGKAQTLLVAIGVPKDAYWYLDAGLTRTASGYLDGKYAKLRVSFLRIIMALRAAGEGTTVSANELYSMRWATHEVLRFHEENPDLDAYATQYASLAQKAGKRFGATTAVGLLVGGYLAGLQTEARRDLWWADVAGIESGSGASEGSPVAALYRMVPKADNTGLQYARAIWAGYKAGKGQTIRNLVVPNRLPVPKGV